MIRLGDASALRPFPTLFEIAALAPPAPSFETPWPIHAVPLQLRALQLQLEMVAAWLLVEQLTSGRCGCHRGSLQRRNWDRWRACAESWSRHAPSSATAHNSDPIERRSNRDPIDHPPNSSTSDPTDRPDPSSTPIDSPADDSGSTSVDCPPLAPGRYDGRTPARETTSQRCSAAVHPPLTNTAGARDPSTYAQVINQFAVGDNPRYARRNGNTYCNIFAWDVTRAMGAELPHWRRHDGTPAQPFERGAYEMNANGTARWLEQHGDRYGWRRVSAEEAQAHANRGAPAVAIRENPGGIGHVAVVRPGELTGRGPCIAQAGGRNFNEGHARDVWRGSEPHYWVHD